MKNHREYSEHWCDFQLDNDSQIKKFYKEYFISIPINLAKLEDNFIDFTYNVYRDFRIIETEGVFEIIEKNEQVNEKYLVLSVPIRNLNSQQSAYCGFEIKSRCL